MSEFPNDLHIDTDNDSQLVATLRAALRAKDKQLGEATKKLETFETKSRASSIEEILKDKGVNAKAAKLIPTDVEATDEAVGKWLEEFGDLFNITQAPQGDAGETGDENEQTGDTGETGGGLSDEDAATFAATQRTSAGGQSAALIGPDRVRQLLQDIKSLPADVAMQKLRDEGLVA